MPRVRQRRSSPVPPPDPERDRLRWVCSLLYFEHALMDRRHISGLTGVFDRKRVAQLLSEAQSRGWVRFCCLPPEIEGLSRRIEAAFELRGARVVAAPPNASEGNVAEQRAPAAASPGEAGGSSALKRVLGGAGARYFVERLAARRGAQDRPLLIGVSGGATLYHLVEALGLDATRSDRPFEAIPISKSEPPSRNTLHLSGGELAGMLAQRMPNGASREFFRFFTPGDEAKLARALDPKSEIGKSLRERYRQLDMVLTGVGGPASPSMQRIRRALGERTSSLPLVGEVLGLPLDRDLARSLADEASVSGLSLQALEGLLHRENPPDLIAIAGGDHKVEPLLSLLGFQPKRVRARREAGPLVNHLVTDAETAGTLLRAIGETPSSPEEDVPTEERARWVAGYLAFVREPAASKTTIGEVLDRENLLKKEGKTSKRVEAASLAREALRKPGRRGVPTILIRSVAPAVVRLEADLADLFRLEVRVAPGMGHDAVARVGAEYLQAEISTRSFQLEKLAAEREESQRLSIGLAGGRALKGVIEALGGHDFRSEASPQVRVYPLVCREPSEHQIADSALADMLTERLWGARSCEILRYVPKDREEFEAIRSVGYVSQFLAEARSVDVALLGIGDARLKHWSGLGARSSYIKAEICGQPIGAKGEPIDFEEPRLLGIRLSDLGQMFVESELERWRRAREQRWGRPEEIRALHKLVAVVAGEAKAPAVSAVLARNFAYARRFDGRLQAPTKRLIDLEPEEAPLINVLIVDEELGEAVRRESAA